MSDSVLNLVHRDRKQLSQANYIRKADPDADYWVGFEESIVQRYKHERGDEFNLIIAGDESTEGDFFVIPYLAVKHMLSDDTITEHVGGRRRWIGSIRNSELKSSHYPKRLDVARFFGTPLFLAGKQFVSEEMINDYAIENRKIEIFQRVKQSAFRKVVVANFDGRCCLSGLSETDLLEEIKFPISC
jgi:putative restriction endonuclease